MNRGDVYWTDFGGRSGIRPAVVVTRDSALDLITAITVAPLTTRIRNVSSRVVVGEEDGLSDASAINLDSLQTVRIEAIGEFICHLSPERMEQVRRALIWALDLELPPPI
ncbi:MAG TPA: type II toxin-antitoxin system PemK/MazF family toxin [Tepidiformaceae bacterium]|nr:type II toxin-antitoxin system PemK/MazF family toxin [Tepidiformaceae bacterium]